MPLDPRGYNTIGHAGQYAASNPSPYGGLGMYAHAPSVPAMHMTNITAPGSYSAAASNQPPLGYIVAHTPEQVADLMRDQYRGPLPPTPGDATSPKISPKRPHSALSQVE